MYPWSNNPQRKTKIHAVGKRKVQNFTCESLEVQTTMPHNSSFGMFLKCQVEPSTKSSIWNQGVVFNQGVQH